MPQPIDPHTELGRISAAERIQQLADRANLAVQARISGDAAQQALMAESQVQETEQKSEQVEQELRQRNPYAGRRKKRQQQALVEADPGAHVFYAADEKPQVFEDPEAHKLDISI